MSYLTTNELDFISIVNGLEVLASDITINFYSTQRDIEITLNNNANKDNVTSKTVYTKKNDGTAIESAFTSTKETFTYDRIKKIELDLVLNGYTFIGWGSENYYNGTEYTSRYSIGDKSLNVWNSTSYWQNYFGLK